MNTSFITGTVEKLVFGGDGLIRKDGLVVFVPGVVPGEEVVVEEVLRKKNFVRARLCEVVRPSRYRIEPKCHHFGVCGGCQLQHIAYEKHAEIKRGWLEEAFFGIFKGKIDFFPAEEIYFWRKKITLHAASQILGYFGKDNTTIVGIDECPLFFTEEKTLLFLKKLLTLIPAREGGEVDAELLRLPSGGIALRIEAAFSLPDAVKKGVISYLCKERVFEKFFLQFGVWSHTEGGFSDPIAFSALGREFFFSLDAFVQNHVTQGERLWQDVVEAQGEKEQRIFDLYSGVGVTALALADKGHEVIAVEGNKDAVMCAKEACQKMMHQPTFLCDSVERALSKLQKKADAWILNPPRTGVSARVLELATKKVPRHITYVSCSPATLVRDLKVLVKSGWHVKSVQGYDMFPQTTHLETIALLSRSE